MLLVGNAKLIVSAWEKSISVVEMIVSTTDKTASWIWIIKSGPATILYGPQYPKMLSEMIAFALEIITCKTELIVSSLPACVRRKALWPSSEHRACRLS
ncbi:MAG: hypothetical protein DMG17_29165 [Acidobacteria bacterium]|nr:MAG: hypothetical protein DMG17_29165 [Acidobacteriota bacterium]